MAVWAGRIDERAATAARSAAPLMGRLVEIAGEVAALDLRGRAKLPCIGEERAELMLPGLAIFEAICEEWPCAELRVADRGLREGILLELRDSM